MAGLRCGGTATAGCECGAARDCSGLACGCLCGAQVCVRRVRAHSGLRCAWGWLGLQRVRVCVCEGVIDL